MKIRWENQRSVLRAVDQFEDIFYQEFSDALMLIGELYVTEIVSHTPVGGGSGPDGHLATSFQVGLPVNTAAGMRTHIGSPAEHGEVIDQGRAPGSTPPPVDAIAVWVWDVRHRFPEVQTEEDARRIAFPIARAIGRHGFSTAADGPGLGWGMIAKALASDLEAVGQVLEVAKERIEMRCSRGY